MTIHPVAIPTAGAFPIAAPALPGADAVHGKAASTSAPAAGFPAARPPRVSSEGTASPRVALASLRAAAAPVAAGAASAVASAVAGKVVAQVESGVVGLSGRYSAAAVAAAANAASRGLLALKLALSESRS